MHWCVSYCSGNTNWTRTTPYQEEWTCVRKSCMFLGFCYSQRCELYRMHICIVIVLEKMQFLTKLNNAHRRRWYRPVYWAMDELRLWRWRTRFEPAQARTWTAIALKRWRFGEKNNCICLQKSGLSIVLSPFPLFMSVVIHITNYAIFLGGHKHVDMPDIRM